MRTRKKDTDFTNIRVHIKTHEELDAIGKRGESMDDIVQKCLAAYKQMDREEYDETLMNDINDAMQQSMEIITAEENMLKEEHEHRRQVEASGAITKDKKLLEKEYNRRNDFLQRFERQRLENVKLLEYWSAKSKKSNEIYKARSQPQAITATPELQQSEENPRSDIHHQEREQQRHGLHIFDKDTINPKPGVIKGGGKRRSIEILIDLPRIEFPTNKIRLMEFVEHNSNAYGFNSTDLYEIFEKLPAKKYMNAASLEESLIELFNNNKMSHIIGEYKVVVGCKINVNEEVSSQVNPQEEKQKH